MNHFEYARPDSIAGAVAALQRPGSKILAGGTNLVDLMKYDVAKPSCLIDINRLPLRSIEALADGGLRLGALVTNADTAYDPRVQARAPLVASAILAGASAQLRNAATTGGNLLQRTRCFSMLAGAVGVGGNTFKIELARRTIVRALAQAAAGTPQSQSDKRIG